MDDKNLFFKKSNKKEGNEWVSWWKVVFEMENLSFTFRDEWFGLLIAIGI